MYEPDEWARITTHGKSPIITCTVWARDKEHAIKITNERRAMAIARGDFDGIPKNKTKRIPVETRETCSAVNS